MNSEVIAPLEKNSLQQTNFTKNNNESGCCGGAPQQHADACCQLDEQKKREGHSGCGCTPDTLSQPKSSSCC